MIIHCLRLTTDRYQTFCTYCHKPVDIVDGDFINWQLHQTDSITCFDCDGGADEVPTKLYPMDNELLVIGDLTYKQTNFTWELVAGSESSTTACQDVPYLKVLELVRTLKMR